MLTILSDQPSVISDYLRELRDQVIQKDRRRFEQNLETIGLLAGYELSKQLTYQAHDTKTPLGIAQTPIISDQLVVSTVLRAGLPLHRGICRVLPNAQPAFIAAGRQADTSHGVAIKLDYVAGPTITDKVLIIADTMLATGHTFVAAYQALLREHGQPRRVVIVAVIASQTGIDYLQAELPTADIIVAAVDPILNDDYFIVPGLGDAGDLLYGEKL